ncbi:hypothetical protein [Quadrisphaera setariae]|uniref:Uncharacterized protein n=1 Tax=Quadrisphaera setariae TaxID=2593304 RepID=A0A5C8ZL04_9ACTN|nr:hypothetical protein [Quadrisphaera setariae]TXR57470.1 hypothetical protein FMM08_04315 [Quadrisphaera setariae]
MITAPVGGEAEDGVDVGRSRARAVALAAGAAGAVVVLAGCGSAAHPLPPGGASSSSSSPTPRATFAWPDPALTVVTTPRGVRPPLDLTWATPGSLQDQIAQEEGISLEEAARIVQDQELVGVFTYDVQERFRDALSTSHAGDESSQGRPWVAFTGTVPPEVVTMAEQLPFPIELRGGALVSSHRNGVIIDAATTAFAADLGVAEQGLVLGGHFDSTTGVVTIDYSTDPLTRRPDAGTEDAVIAAAQGALGWDAPLSVDVQADDRDPTTTNAATWFLPEGFVPDPAATRVEVLVVEQGCTGGRGAEGNTAPPEVEVTGTQVRIAVSTYIRKGAQGCPNHPAAPLVVDLGQQLGNRELVDVHGRIDDGAGEGMHLGGPVQVPAAG